MPLTQHQIESTFGKFDWHAAGRRGAIEIAFDWTLHNIARIEPPFPLMDGSGKPLKRIACHALIADDLLAILTDMLAAKLTHLINTFDGCWCARHMRWDPIAPLSSHSWGISVDLNARLFPYGSPKKQDSRLINIFARHGFEWGGSWRTPDPMHFEFVGLPQAGVPQALACPSQSHPAPVRQELAPAQSHPAPVRQELAPAQSVKVIIDDQLITEGKLLSDGHIWAPVRPIAQALGATVTYHPEQRKLYIYRS